MLSTLVGWSLEAIYKEGLGPPNPSLVIITMSVVIAILTLGFLGVVYVLRKVGKKRIAFNSNRVFISAFLIIFVSQYLWELFPTTTMIAGCPVALVGVSNPSELPLAYIRVGIFWSLPSLVVATISSLIYSKIHM